MNIYEIRNPKELVNVKNWKEFSKKIKGNGFPLLTELDEFQKSILVTGCQRSGTTMVFNVIKKSKELSNIKYGPQNEFESALILAGIKKHEKHKRYCFQTTYINKNINEYMRYKNEFQMILKRC